MFGLGFLWGYLFKENEIATQNLKALELSYGSTHSNKPSQVGKFKPGDRVEAAHDGVGSVGDVFTKKGWRGYYQSHLKGNNHNVFWDNGCSWCHIGVLNKVDEPPIDLRFKKAYSVGDKVKFIGEDYYVVKNSIGKIIAVNDRFEGYDVEFKGSSFVNKRKEKSSIFYKEHLLIKLK